jgi:hypothetical protein
MVMTMDVNCWQIDAYLNELDRQEWEAAVGEQLAALNHLARRHDLEAVKVIQAIQGQGYAIQFVYRPADNPSYEKWFVSVWRDDLGELFDMVRETLESEEMNIFSTNLFEFLSGEMIGDKEITLTIQDVREEMIDSARGSDEKPVVSFVERKKKWVLNKTSARFLAETLGQETDNWRSHRVVLHAPYVVAFGRNVRALRIKDVLPPENSNGRREAKPKKTPAVPEDYSAEDANEELFS